MRYALNTTPVNGNATLYGMGLAAPIVVGAAGFSLKQKKGEGQPAPIVFGGAGTMKKALGGRGTAPIAFGGSGTMRQAKGGASLPAAIKVAAAHGIPNPMPQRLRIVGPNSMRTVYVLPDRRDVLLPIETRAITVPADVREISVTREVEPV